MAQDDALTVEARPRGRKRRIARGGGLALLVILLAVIAAAWLMRKTLADDFIAQTFRDNDIEATWTVESISPQRQVLTDLVIGDPARPDLTIDRLELSIRPRFGLPDVTALKLVRPVIRGTYRGGQLSFGQLDPLIFPEESGEPFEFPNLRLSVEEGRGLLLTDFGQVDLALSGGGHLRGGFAGVLAATSERLDGGGCTANAPRLHARLSIDAERPRLAGPLRFDRLACHESELAVNDGTAILDVRVDRNLEDMAGTWRLATADAAFAGNRLAVMAGEGEASWRGGELAATYDLAARDLGTVAGSARIAALEGQVSFRDGAWAALYDLAAREVASPHASFTRLEVDGRVRTLSDLARIDAEGEVRGIGLSMGGDLDGAIAGAAERTRGTLLAPLLDRLGLNLARELRGSTLAASFDARSTGALTSVAIPEARLRGGSGRTVLALSRGQLTLGSATLPRFAGNFATGGEGLPQITGRMEQAAGGALDLRLAMREYGAGQSSLAVPQMRVVQARDGRVALDGRVLASGPLPGGFAQGLDLPVDGTIAPDGSLALWNGCRAVRFERLAYANLTLDRQSLTLCPTNGRPILAYGPGGLRLAAGASSLDVSGRLAQTPIRVRSGPVGVAYPGALAARNLDVTLGPASNAQRFRITDLRADLSGDAIGGDFAGADVFLASVPLDVLGASGTWRYAGDRLTLADTSFMLHDRQDDARFEPLSAQGASLSLYDNRIVADAALRHPGSGQVVTEAHIEHDLASGTGFADLPVPGLTFAVGGLQPADLTRLALGVVANVEGTVAGGGRIDWGAGGVTSTGSFSSDSLDLAASFGPVQGASGTVVFTDLLGLTTAPDQRIRVASVNPGIEVFDGEIGFQLVNGERIAISGGTWPFMGGTLTLRSVDINLGVEESRTYVLDIVGLEAAQFVERMEVGNLAATGTFDGSVPIVFDAEGNGSLVGGRLLSRPPGGNVSYVGELSYEDLSFFANYAFRTLRDLQYDRMEILLNGSLTGELVTQVNFSGIRQGPTAERNLVSRVIGDLPIELRVNIRAPFLKLISSLRALNDPTAVRDPRSLGLIGADGEVLRETVDQATVDRLDEEAAEDAACELLGGAACETDEDHTANIQPQESEPMP
ncbi:intermembrane phospholipid transport protein YdbH family protein [Aurantiacibacter luteus]|uniref:intermembrane phospholipid transport protein YdbH family protein n=1 Tax=Aurantiacibacter luteus TaxID=1581420 RepID=UPI00069A9970|nr:YdbH domain-containing protein [Aurantiacibacter luteus]